MIRPLQFDLTTKQEDYLLFAEWMSGTDPWMSYNMNALMCLQAFSGDGKEVFKVTADGRPVAFIVLQMYGSFKGYIQTLCVHPSYRNQGIGHSLLHFCEERIFSISPNIFICVSTLNDGAQKLYFEYGFKQIGIIPDFVVPGFDEILLRKTIGSMIGFKPKSNK